MLVEAGVRGGEGEGMRGMERMESISEIMIGNFHEWLCPQVSLYFLNADIVGGAKEARYSHVHAHMWQSRLGVDHYYIYSHMYFLHTCIHRKHARYHSLVRASQTK